MSAANAPRILVVGGGYVGMYAALRLQRRLRPEEGSITVVDPQSYMTYRRFLPEAGAGNLEPRHVVVPLRRVLKKCRILNGVVTKVDHSQRIAQVRRQHGPRAAHARRRSHRRVVEAQRPVALPAGAEQPCSRLPKAGRFQVGRLHPCAVGAGALLVQYFKTFAPLAAELPAIKGTRL